MPPRKSVAASSSPPPELSSHISDERPVQNRPTPDSSYAPPLATSRPRLERRPFPMIAELAASNAVASSSRTPLSPKPKNSSRKPSPPVYAHLDSITLKRSSSIKSSKSRKVAKPSVFDGLVADLKEERDAKKRKTSVGGKPTKGSKSEPTEGLLALIEKQRELEEALEAARKPGGSSKVKPGGADDDLYTILDDSDHGHSDFEFEQWVDEGVPNLADEELEDLLDDGAQDDAELDIPLDANIRDYITIPSLRAVPLEYSEILYARFIEIDGRMMREAPVSGLWRRILEDLTAIEKYAIVLDAMNLIMLKILAGELPPEAIKLLDLGWEGDGFIVYLKLAIAKTASHKSFVYTGSGTRLPPWLGGPYGGECRRQDHIDSIGCKTKAKTKNNLFDNTMRAKPDDRTLEFVTAYCIPIDFTTATKQHLIDVRIRVLYVEGLLHEWLQSWLDQNGPPNSKHDTSFWNAADIKYIGMNSAHPLAQSIRGVSNENYRTPKRVMLDRMNARLKWRWRNEPGYAPKMKARSIAWHKKKRAEDPAWVEESNRKKRVYWAEHGEQKLEEYREKYQNDDEEWLRRSESCAKHRANHRESHNARSRAYHKANLTAVKAKKKVYRENNREWRKVRDTLRRKINRGEATEDDMLELKKSWGKMGNIRGTTRRPHTTKAAKAARAAAVAGTNDPNGEDEDGDEDDGEEDGDF